MYGTSFRFAIAGAVLACLAATAAFAVGNCRALLGEGISYFGRYDQDPANVDRALAAYAEAAEDPACAYEAHWRLADMYLCWGSTRTDKKERIALFKKGVHHAEIAVRLSPDRPEGHHFYSVTLGSIVDTGGVVRHLGKIGKVKKAMEQALAADPDYAPALVVQAEFLMDMPVLFGGDDAKAYASLLRAIEVMPLYETSYNSLAKYYLKKKRYAEAVAVLDRLEAIPESDRLCLACYLTIDRPRAQALRAEVLKQMERNR